MVAMGQLAVMALQRWLTVVARGLSGCDGIAKLFGSDAVGGSCTLVSLERLLTSAATWRVLESDGG